MSFDLTPILAVHDAVRRDLVRLVQIVGGTEPVTAERAAALQKHWPLVTGVLTAHERAEDTLLWPQLRAVVPAGDAGAVDAAAAQHPGLETAVAAAGSLLGDAQGLTNRTRRDELAGALERAAVLVDHHFALEEDRLLPLVQRWVPADSWEAFVSAWRRDVGPGGEEAVVPFLLQAAHPDRAASLLATLDDGQRAAYRGEWRPAHQARVALLW